MPHLQLYGRDYAAKKRATTEAAFSSLAARELNGTTGEAKHDRTSPWN